ncbi:hypothetical protein HanXRQr2_Chr06g0263111 [Helianthus annuus]|uniref:Uncharacterized protein n=1 Tax=Helianthus annuus TaxID=4232 RepID=A0A251UKR7_HELAN|nr:hypothetical protein HanXRQr2_Chr06g0263111 [Helianthus annuus]KAJ0915774.1 hypothetical protein HanPSC8_Chr06g0253771 [Helianthus annuus]
MVCLFLVLLLQIDGSVPNTRVTANCGVVKPKVAAAEYISQVEYSELADAATIRSKCRDQL